LDGESGFQAGSVESTVSVDIRGSRQSFIFDYYHASIGGYGVAGRIAGASTLPQFAVK
jgi:hypothetical protein